MAKVNFSKVEKSFDNAVQKLLIDSLADLASIANVIQDPEKNMSSQAIADVIGRFHKQLKKIKKEDPGLYSRLDLTEAEEERLSLPSTEYTGEDWIRLRALKLRIDEVKKELYGEGKIDAENDEIVNKERRKHKNKRFNIRDGWLPLH